MNARRVVGWTVAAVLALLVSVAGHRAAAAQMIQAERVVDTTTSIPEGTGNFTGFGAPSLSAGRTSFFGTGSGDQQGLYWGVPPAGGGTVQVPPSLIANTSTPIPNGTGNFTEFRRGVSFPTVVYGGGDDGDEIVFYGEGTGSQQGIYRGLMSLVETANRIADTNTPIPGGTGNFTSFEYGVPHRVLQNPIDGDPVTIRAAGSGGQQGIYTSRSGSLEKVADTNTPIPEGTGNFESFSLAQVISGENVAFVGSGSGGQQGVYAADPTRPIFGGALADTSTLIPGGLGTFTDFADIALFDQDVAFIGSGSGGQKGLYKVQGDVQQQGTSEAARVADTSMPIPGGVGTFTDFLSVGINATDIAFLASGSGGQSGIFDYHDGSLVSLVNVGDILDGKLITDLSFTGGGLFEDQIAFGAVFADGSEGIYTMSVPEPTSFLLLALGSLVLGVSRLSRRRQ